MAATLDELDRRVSALEKAQNETTVTMRWVVGTLGQIQAVQGHHTSLLQEHSAKFDKLFAELESLRAEGRRTAEELRTEGRRTSAELQSLRAELPTIVGDMMREVLAEPDKRKR